MFPFFKFQHFNFSSIVVCLFVQKAWLNSELIEHCMQWIVLYEMSDWKWFDCHIPPSCYVFFSSFGQLRRDRFASPPPSPWPCGSLWLPGPTPQWCQGYTSSMEVSLLCSIVKVLLMYLGFYSKNYIILSSTWTH